MRHYPKLLRATLTALLLATSIALVNAGPSDDWNAAFDAFKRSDYATALALFRSLAEQGYAGDCSNLASCTEMAGAHLRTTPRH